MGATSSIRLTTATYRSLEKPQIDGKAHSNRDAISMLYSRYFTCNLRALPRNFICNSDKCGI